MTAGEVEFVDITPLADGAPEPTPGGTGANPWRPTHPLVWAGGLLLLAACVLSLLTVRSTAWTSTAVTGPSRSVHTDLAGNTVVTQFDLPTQVTTTRLDGWGRSTVSTVVEDSGNPGVSGVGHGPKLGLGFVIGAVALAGALTLLAASRRRPNLVRSARTAAIAATALLAGIWLSGFIDVYGARDQFLTVDPTGPSALDEHHFHFGNAVYLGLAAVVLAVVGLVLADLGGRRERAVVTDAGDTGGAAFLTAGSSTSVTHP